MMALSPAWGGEEPENKILRFEALRSLLAEKFPEATALLPTSEPGETALIPPRLLTEISGSSGSVSLLMQSALGAELAFAGLVDASDAFDPSELPEECLRRLLWVRCGKVATAIQAVDLLLRDGNLPLLFLDLRMVAAQELRSIPAGTWHRFQLILEQSRTSLGICTLRPSISAARLRVQVANQWTLRDLLRPREELIAALRTHSHRRGANPVSTPAARRIA